MFKNRKPDFVATCGNDDCCTFVTRSDGFVRLTNERGQEIDIPQDEWTKIRQAVLDKQI